MKKSCVKILPLSPLLITGECKEIINLPYCALVMYIVFYPIIFFSFHAIVSVAVHQGHQTVKRTLHLLKIHHLHHHQIWTQMTFLMQNQLLRSDQYFGCLHIRNNYEIILVSIFKHFFF